jgi:hypothetical protein
MESLTSGGYDEAQAAQFAALLPQKQPRGVCPCDGRRADGRFVEACREIVAAQNLNE